MNLSARLSYTIYRIMQARLPDINTAIIRHRNNALQCFAGNDDVGAALSISAWNALMPDEYKVEVNTIKYNKLVAEKKTISCDYCKEDIPYNEIEFYDILLSRFESFLTGKKWKKCWRCKDCEKENTVNLAKIKIIKFQQPDYIKIIPDPPQRGAG